MGVSTKGKRKIIVENKEYFWHIGLDYDSPYHILNIFSKDKSLLVSCPLKTETSYLINKGLFFQNQKTNGIWNRYLLPFSVPDIITPAFVSKIVMYTTNGTNAKIVKYNGKDIPI
jgi:hypothetical protein